MTNNQRNDKNSTTTTSSSNNRRPLIDKNDYVNDDVHNNDNEIDIKQKGTIDTLEDDDDDMSNDNNDDDDDSEDYEEEDDSSSWKDDLVASWRQHCFAVGVAVVATMVSYYYQQQQQQMMTETLTSPTTWMMSRNRNRDLVLSSSHPHLDQYTRTANVTFCSNGILKDVNQLRVMDFQVPLDLIPTMELHFAADWERDDDYSSVLKQAVEESSSSTSSVLSKEHPQYDCLEHLKATTAKDYIKGLTLYYKDPSFDSMYQQHIDLTAKTSVKKEAPKLSPAHLTFTGFSAKFINLSPDPVLLYWDGRSGEKRRLVGELAPFESLTTATTPGQSFSISPVYDPTDALDRWVVTADDAVQYYEPDNVVTKLNPHQTQLYNMQQLNRKFAHYYQVHSHRTWLAQFPRAFPVHPMWPADYFGQTHQIARTTDDDDEKNTTKKASYKLEVVSVTPRVFTISNFLTEDECDALMDMALSQGMTGSTVYAGNTAKEQRHRSTRSSSNAWLARDTADTTDHIYRRAAHILQLDESLLQKPIDDTVHDAYQHSIAESLQVIRYQEKEEYAAHHDWVIPSQTHRHQPTRFATLLMYLNDDFQGGHTVFPRAVNAQYHDGIRIEPRKGKAVLFYNILPDGNVDDLSQHASEPVTKGEKFAANLWIWEPMIN